MNLNGKQIPCTDKPNEFAYRAHNLQNTNAIFVLSDEVDELYGVAETFCRISFDFLVFDPFSVCVICHLNRFCRRIIFASWDFASEPGRYDAFSPTFSYVLVVSLLNLLLSLFAPYVRNRNKILHVPNKLVSTADDKRQATRRTVETEKRHSECI